MPLKTVPVPIPLGGGLQESKHEWRRRPPNAQTVRNMTLRKGEAYQKRPGFAVTATAISGAASEVLVPQRTALALMNEAGAHIVADGVVTAQDFGGHIPTEVVTHPIAPFRGAVSGEQIAKNGDYIALVLTEADPDTDISAVMIIVNSSFEIVAGPERSEDIANAPRVEALGTGFAFFGFGDDFNETLGDLRYVFWSPGTGFGSSVVISDVSGVGSGGVPMQASLETKCVVYDTCPGPADLSSVLIVYRYDNGGLGPTDTNLYAHRLTSALANARLDLGTVTPGTGNDAIWYDEDSDTVAVYDGSGDVVHTNSLLFDQAAHSVAYPSTLAGIPVFYRSGALTDLNTSVVTFLGGSPRDVTISAAIAGFTPIFHKRPVQRGLLGSYFFADYAEESHETDAELLVKGRAALITAENATLPGGGVTENRIVVPLAEDRLPLWRMTHFHGDEPRVPAGVVGQVVLEDNVIYIPQLVANAAYLAPPLQTEDDPSVSGVGNFTDAINAAVGISDAVEGRTGGAGINEGVSQLIITEIRRTTPNYSAIDYYGTTLVAAGALSVFDGVDSLPAILDRPLAASIVENGINAGAVGTALDASYTIQAHQLFLAAGDAVDMKGVLVYIDRNGIKYRSDSFDLGTIENTEAFNQYYAPQFNLTLSENLTSMGLSSMRLTLEVYTNEIYTPPAPAGTAFHLMFRGGVKWDGTNYSVDGTTFYSPSRTLGPTDAWAFNPTNLYTTVGDELGPRTPPASNVLAQAGNYLFLLSSEDPYDIRFTKPLDDRIGPEFNPLLSLEAPPESGGVVSLSGESDRLLLLCRNGVWDLFVGGGGPDSAGVGSFPPFRKVWGGEGCVTHRATVSGMFGTFFVSDSGPKIVGRDGSVTDIGRDLGLSDLTAIRRAVYYAADQEIWLFMTPSESIEAVYIFDLTAGQWTSGSFEAKAVTIKDGTLYRLRSEDLAVLGTDASTTADGDATDYYLGKYVSPWLTFDSPQAYKRVRDVAVLIQLLSGTQGSLVVRLAYDYVDSNIDSETFTFATIDSLAKPVHLSLKPTRQKFDAIRVTVEDAQTTVVQGQSSITKSDLMWALADISLEVGMKSGTIKLQQEAKQ